MRLKIAIVDDEDLARAVVREYLAGMPDVEIVAECANGFEAVKAVSELQPDLLILDVQMPKLNGFEVLELVGRDVAVVFVTAYDQYAIRAFEVHAVDYLLKPFGAERLAAAIDRVRERLGRGDHLPVHDLTAAARPAQDDQVMLGGVIWPPVVARVQSLVHTPTTLREVLKAAARTVGLTAGDVLRGLEILHAAGLVVWKA